MSAWIVSKQHIDVLVAGVRENRGFRHRGKFIIVLDDDEEYTDTAETMTTTELGAMLWRENHRSINYRYGSRERTPAYSYCAPKKYQTDHNEWCPGRPLVDRAVLAKQVCCYDYQTCEHSTYHKSRAYSVVLELSAVLLSKVEGYESAPWGID